MKRTTLQLTKIIAIIHKFCPFNRTARSLVALPLLLALVCVLITCQTIRAKELSLSLAPYLQGSGKYNCFPAKIWDCGPKPPKLSGYSLKIVTFLDQVTRKLNNKSVEKKVILILSPLLAGTPLTASMAAKAWTEGVADTVESGIVTLINTSPKLEVDDKAANVEFVRQLFRTGLVALDTVKTLKKLTNYDSRDLKKANDFFKASLSIDKKVETLQREINKLAKTSNGASPHGVAKAKLQKAQQAMARCDFGVAAKLLDQAYKKMQVSCRRDGFRYRKNENLKDCFYGEWYPDRMKPGYPKYDIYHNIILDDFNNVSKDIIDRLPLFQDIDRARQKLKKEQDSWVSHVQRINFHIRNAQQAISYGQLQRSCQAVRNVMDSEKQIARDMPSCAGKMKDVGRKLKDKLHQRVKREQKEIANQLSQAEAEIRTCRLDQAERTLDPLQSKVNQLVILDGHTCRPTMISHNMVQNIKQLYGKIAQARRTRCKQGRPASLGDLQGEWKWFNGDTVRVTGGGAYSLTRKWVRATVVPDPKNPGKFIFNWFEHGKPTWVDGLWLSRDKKGLSGSNTVSGVSATRIGAPPGGSYGTGGQGTQGANTSGTGSKPSCEDCVRKYCPQCGELLFCQSNEVNCSNCITRNQTKIDACQR